MSQDLYGLLKERARLGRFSWPMALAFSALVHAGLTAALVAWPGRGGKAEDAKVTWVTLPAAGGGTPGGASPMEEGQTGERVRRVEEVAPKSGEDTRGHATPDAFGTKGRLPVKGTSDNPASTGKAPEASNGAHTSPSLARGTAGQGNGSGVGIGTGVPGLKNSFGVDGGTGLIGDLDGSFPFLWYLQQVQNRITANWSRMSSAPGRVQVYFRIRKDGGLEGIRVEVPSGNAAMDQSALLAVRRSDPLPRLPDGFDAKTLGVRFWFSYVGP